MGDGDVVMAAVGLLVGVGDLDDCVGRLGGVGAGRVTSFRSIVWVSKKALVAAVKTIDFAPDLTTLLENSLDVPAPDIWWVHCKMIQAVSIMSRKYLHTRAQFA